MAYSSRARISGQCSTIYSLPFAFFLFLLKSVDEIVHTNSTLTAPNQSTVTTVAECFQTSCVWARFLIGFQSMSGQRGSQPTPTSLGQRRVRVRCHLPPALLEKNDRGLLRATAVTRGWNGHWIRASTQSWLWRRKFSGPSCQDSNSQPFDHESSTLTNKFVQAPSNLQPNNNSQS